MSAFIRAIQDLFLLIVRVAFGALMIAHGWRRWQHLGVQSQIAYLTQFSVPYPQYAAWAAVILELVGGIFLIVGAVTPLIALLFVAEQAATIAYTNFYHRDPTTVSGTIVQGWEYNAALGAIALMLLVFGAGRISVDQLFRRKKDDDEGLPEEV